MLRVKLSDSSFARGTVESTGLRTEAINHTFWDRRRVPRSDHDVVLRTACGLLNILRYSSYLMIFATTLRNVGLDVVSCTWYMLVVSVGNLHHAGVPANLKTRCQCQDEAVHER